VNDSNFLKEIGRSYIVSAFLPAAIFVLLAYFLFRGFVPSALVTLFKSNPLYTNFQWVILFFLAMWVAFYLFSADDITVRFFEGYSLPTKLRNAMVKAKQKTWHKDYEKFERWEGISQKIQSRIDKSEAIYEDELKELSESLLEAQSALAALSIRSPLNPEKLLPTRLGNVLRASEMYAYERYAIAEISIWPRLTAFLPLQLTRNLEEKDNHFMFLINSAFLTVATGTICILVGLLGIPITLFSRFFSNMAANLAGFFYVGYDLLPFWSYLVIAMVFYGFSYVMYSIAVNVAEDYGMYVRTSFDLYRIELLRQLHWPAPKNIEEEKHIWENISRYIIAANRFGKVELPNYEYPEQSEKKETEPSILRLKDDTARWPGR
jgi:hypothetical protein